MFKAALERASDQRAAFLAEACADDPALHAEVQGSGSRRCRPAGRVPRRARRHRSGADSRPEASHEGQRIGAYTLIRRIGRGGMGAVYLAQRHDIDKRSRSSSCARRYTSSAAIERFLLERRLLARLEHPNIARYSTPA
jgi:serine/threonine protein kinase